MTEQSARPVSYTHLDVYKRQVYGIVVAELVFFFSFGLNQWLQYKGVGRWRSYAYGEKTYLVLSLAAKSILAWQIYGGSLAD